MTIKRAEHLTGYEIRRLPAEQGGLITFGAFNNGGMVIKASGRVEWMALRTIVQRVYGLHSRIAMEPAGWRCSRCGSRSPCVHIIENIARTVEPTGSTIWSLFVRIATGSSTSWNVRCERRGKT